MTAARPSSSTPGVDLLRPQPRQRLTTSRAGLAALPRVAASLATTAIIIMMALSAGATAQSKVGKSGLPLPRYVSLKSDKVNLRTGPGIDYPTTWVYRRAGLPLEVFDEFQNWRHVRDSEGTEGWIFSSLLSGRRTALVLPWERKNNEARPTTAVYVDNSARARKVAIIEAGVIADVHGCDGRWCEVTIDTFNGYVEQAKLWGVYPNESWD